MTITRPRDLTRRLFVERAGLLALGTAVWPSWMPRMAFRQQQNNPSGDVLIVVFARGGYDGLNMIIPYGDESDYARRRPTIAIPSPDSTAARKAVQLDSFFGMHPTLHEAGWKDLYDSGTLAIVHAMHMDDPTRSHFDAMDYMERGTPGRKSVQTGWLNRHLTSMTSQNESPFRAVGMGTMLQPSLRGPVPAVVLQSITDFHLQGNQAEIVRFQQHLQQLYAGDGWLDKEGQSTFAAIDLLEQNVGYSPYEPSNGAVYPASSFGRGMSQVAQLVKAEVGLEIACVDTGGWDTHANQVDADDPTTGNMANLMDNLAKGITAFATDMRDNFDATNKTSQGITVVVLSEFGRRAAENGGVGTDHGHGNAMYVLGKGILGGKVYAQWPGLADDDLNRGDLDGTTEYRDVLGEILEKRIGNRRIDDVFPSHAFNYVGLARSLAIATPTPTDEPTAATPTAEPTTVATPTPESGESIFLPWNER